MKTEVAYVERMIELLAPEGAWITGPAWGRDGRSYDMTVMQANQFCVFGAWHRVFEEWKPDMTHDGRIDDELIEVSFEVSLHMIHEAQKRANDCHATELTFNEAPGRTHAEIMDYLAKVRERAVWKEAEAD
jgi:hypothetical protein